MQSGNQLRPVTVQDRDEFIILNVPQPLAQVGFPQESKGGEQLAELIQNEIAPEQWSAAGGVGVAIYYPPTASLVVYHTRRVRADVEQFLAKLVRSRDNLAR